MLMLHKASKGYKRKRVQRREKVCWGMLIFHKKCFVMHRTTGYIYIHILYLNLQNLHISFVVVSLTLYLHFSTGDSPEIYLAKETDIAAR